MVKRLKNQLFAPMGILTSDGKMLHLRPREEVDIGKVKLDDSHMKSMLRKGYVVLREEGKTLSAKTPPSPSAEKDKPKGKEAEESASESKRK